jgi:hypothetical protein
MAEFSIDACLKDMAVEPTRSAKTRTTNRVFLLKIDNAHSSSAASETLQGAAAL